MVEGSPATFTLTAANPAPDRDISVRYRVFVRGGLASGHAGVHTVVIGTSGTAVVSIPTVDDAVVGNNGLISLMVLGGSGYRVHDSDFFSIVNVVDNDSSSNRPTLYVTWSATDSVMVEGSSSDTAEVQVRLNRPLASGESLTVDLDRTNTPSVWSFALVGSPSGVSFDASLSRLTFSAGAQAASITVTAAANVVDGTANGTVSHLFHLSAMDGVAGAVGYIGSAYQRRLLIIDSANTGAAVSLWNSSGNGGYVDEDDYASLVFELSSARSQATTVRFEVVGWGEFPTGSGDLGRATWPAVPDPPTLWVSVDAQYETVIPAGATLAIVAIPVGADVVRDGDKMFAVSIVSTSPGARVGAATSHLLVAADTTPDPGVPAPYRAVFSPAGFEIVEHPDCAIATTRDGPVMSTVSYTVQLDRRPSSGIQVTVTVYDPDTVNAANTAREISRATGYWPVDYKAMSGRVRTVREPAWSPHRLLFDESNWNTPQTVTVNIHCAAHEHDDAVPIWHITRKVQTNPTDPHASREILVEHPEWGWVKGPLTTGLPASYQPVNIKIRDNTGL
ncbi:MAG: hypothetical protein OXT07_03690 [bacterium]|nr:hypothetical protein [bacterium]